MFHHVIRLLSPRSHASMVYLVVCYGMTKFCDIRDSNFARWVTGPLPVLLITEVFIYISSSENVHILSSTLPPSDRLLHLE